MSEITAVIKMTSLLVYYTLVMLTLHEWTVGIFNIQRNNLNGTSKNAHPPEGMITHKFRDYNIYKMMLS